MPRFLSLLACIYLSAVQTRVKEEQIDTPSGSCLALAVFGTYDGFYREKTPKHKMAEVSKFRKSQMWERAADLCCLNFRVLMLWIWMLHKLVFYITLVVSHFLVFKRFVYFCLHLKRIREKNLNVSIFWLQLDQLASTAPILVVHGCRHVDACIRYPN